LIIVVVITGYSTVSSPSVLPNNPITQYILDLSNDIDRSIQRPDDSVFYDSTGEVRLKLFLSPWGELKDAYISQSSGSKELDNICLKAVWLYERYQPFPEELGDDELWLDVPIIFDIEDRDIFLIEVKEDWFVMDEDIQNINISGIEEVVDIALENDISTEIALKEVELSRLKIREARRALYPSASLNYMEVTGATSVDTQNFIDKEYKLKFEYPLYYGWRLKYAVDQAIVNMKASRYSYDNVLRDLRGSVEEAFYAYLINKVNVKIQMGLLKEVKNIFNTAEKRFDIELSTMAEFLRVESQLKQVTYQVASSENDLAIAKITLAQVMSLEDVKGLDNLLNIDINMMDLKPIEVNLSLEDCMETAFRNRTDLKAKEYMVEFNEYERKIARSKDQLKVDLTGSYGKSGGAFESETLNLGADWFLGIKISKPLGGNTLSTSYTKEETSEKHGQTTRTESLSKAVEFGLLDNLQSFSEKKSAEIALAKARQEAEETEELIFKEVKESYLNYKKGLIQVSANSKKIKYRKEELKITKARAELNEIPFSELVQAHINLTDEKSFYIEAMGSLYQSLAKLNKATAYSLFLDSESLKLANLHRLPNSGLK